MRTALSFLFLFSLGGCSLVPVIVDLQPITPAAHKARPSGNPNVSFRVGAGQSDLLIGHGGNIDNDRTVLRCRPADFLEWGAKARGFSDARAVGPTPIVVTATMSRFSTSLFPEETGSHAATTSVVVEVVEARNDAVVRRKLYEATFNGRYIHYWTIKSEKAVRYFSEVLSAAVLEVMDKIMEDAGGSVSEAERTGNEKP